MAASRSGADAPKSKIPNLSHFQEFTYVCEPDRVETMLEVEEYKTQLRIPTGAIVAVLPERERCNGGMQ